MPVSVVIPAFRAGDSIGATVAAARAIAGVAEIIVVDDGSGDGTSQAARAAGADVVITLPRNVGKGGALAAGVAAARGDTLLFLDSELGTSAACAGRLLECRPDPMAMSVAVFPKRAGTGGFGFVKGLARGVIHLLTGLRVEAPLSGQRALPAALVRHIGLAPRFGVETALTVEAAHLGVPVVEEPLPLDHRHTGRTVSGFRHRFGQFRDILRYAVPVLYGLGWPALTRRQTATRLALWLAGFAALLGFALRFPLAWVGPVTVLLADGGDETAFLLAERHMLPAAATMALVLAAALALWVPSLWLSTVLLRVRKTNYLGRAIPGAAGLLFLLVALPCVWLSPWVPGPHLRAASAIVIATFGGVGLLDDLYGHRAQARGLRGHVRALLRGRVTTGAVKAVAGLAAGLVAGWLLRFDPEPVWNVVVSGLVIALTANLLNLLDLRPGRALKGFGLLVLPMLLAPLLRHYSRWDGGELLLLGPLLAAALVSAPSDLAGRTMMGDVGANILGGVAGLALVVNLTPWARIVALALLIAIHAYCERASLTELFAHNRVLRFLDRIGATHLPPLPAAEEVRR